MDEYIRLSQEEIDKLDSDMQLHEFVISHVGDGEYECNVFGNIYSSYTIALKMANESLDELHSYKKYELAKEVRVIEHGTSYNKVTKQITTFYIGSFIMTRNEKEIFLPVARLTLETLDNKFYPGA